MLILALADLEDVLLFFSFMAVPAVLVGWLVRRQVIKTRDELRAFAQQAGLRVMEQNILGFASVKSLEGEQQGRRVRYWTYSTGSGKSRTTWVAVGVGVPAGPALEFELTRQHFGTKLMELFGVHEIQVGDPAFDRAWFVRTNQPEFFTAALGPAIRARFMAEASRGRSPSYKLERGMVRYAEMGGLSAATAGRLAVKLPLLHDLADVAEVSAGQKA
ncbi:MAG: hypothetical protein PSW75_05600 [bacterium]|nr:hypothetical protein [bacterium]